MIRILVPVAVARLYFRVADAWLHEDLTRDELAELLRVSDFAETIGILTLASGATKAPALTWHGGVLTWHKRPRQRSFIDKTHARRLTWPAGR